MSTEAAYGSWRSPITPDLLVEKVVGLSYPMPQGEAAVWVEMRPSEGGRYAIVRRDPGGGIADVLPAGFAARTLVHEYGGLSSTVHGDTMFFSNFTDQRLYRVVPGGEPQPITPEPPQPAAHRYADPVVSPDGRWLVCVRERHTEEAVINEIAVLPTDGSAEPRVLAAGHDFYSSPRMSPAG